MNTINFTYEFLKNNDSIDRIKVRTHPNDFRTETPLKPFLDKNFKIGVNCYGIKPHPSDDEQALLHLSNAFFHFSSIKTKHCWVL